MKLKSLNKTIFLSTLFASALISASASAQIIPDGDYTIAINPTPYYAGIPGIADVGTDGAWNSSFTFGAIPLPGASQLMTDNNIIVNTGAGPRGSSHGGDGYAGTIGINVSGNTFSNFSFQIDTIPRTAGGDLAQYGPQSGMTGTIDQTTGLMAFTPTGRLATVSAFAGFLYDRRWNVEVEPDWASFTTGATTNAAGTINGTPIANLGDINGDGRPDFSATLVSGSNVGSDWGDFHGAPYFEVWNVIIFSGTDLVIIPPPPPPPPLTVSMSVTGGLAQECATTGGNHVAVSAVISPSDAVITNISWKVDGNTVASGESASLFLPLGTHSVGVTVEIDDGRTDSESKTITIQDTTPPVIDVALVDSRSGEAVTIIDRPNVSWIQAKYSATDICDASPSTNGFGGFAVANGDTLKVQGNLNTVTLTTSVIELSASTEDASGNTASGKATLNIID
ncbi:MAG: hypothetical protein OEW89_03515 [Gammaproteobacteria bacterium]|nr:hypothetical protein [Gammaproteobacteria bacterium]MDH5594617.1 hypothetical protein [Gammaproteobacteria bacterium]